MKKITIFALITMIFSACSPGSNQQAPTGIENIQDSANTIYQEIRRINQEAETLAITFSANQAINAQTGMDDKNKKIATLRNTLDSVFILARQTRRVVDSAVEQHQSASNDDEKKQAEENAKQAFGKLMEAKERAVDALDRIKSLIGQTKPATKAPAETEPAKTAENG